MLISELKELYELEKQKIMARNSPDLVKELYEAFDNFKARLDDITDGSLLFMLSFLSETDIDYFWQNYEAESVDKVLSGILITPKMRSLAEEAGCTIRIRLKIDKKEYEIVKEILHEEIDLSQNYLGAVGCMALLELPNTVHVVVEHKGIERGALGYEQHTTKVQSMEDYLSLLNVSNIVQLKEKMAKVTKLEASALPHDVAKTLLTNISLFSELKFLNASACTKVEEPKYGESQLDISHNCISYVGARSVIGMLEKLTELEYFDLSKNNIGDVGAKTLSEIIGKLTKLTHLDLSDNSITNMGAISISNGLKGAVQLQNLYLGHNSIGQLAAESTSGSFAIIKCTEILDLSYANLRDAGVGEPSGGMKDMVGMIKLSLKNNNFGDRGAEELSKGMVYLERLQHLDVCNNHIGSRGVAALCFGLQQCNKLTHILLGHNCIGDEGVKRLSKHMVFLEDLEHFDISGNQIGDRGFKEVFKMLEHLKQLKHLDVSQNVIADVGLKRLANNAHFLGNLQYLDLSHNAIEKKKLVSLSQEMKYMKMLEKLDLSHNEMGTVDARYLCVALKDMENLRWLQVEVAFKDIDIKVKEELYKGARRLNVEMDDSSKNTKGTKEVNGSKPSHDERKAFVERQESFCSRTSSTSHESSCSSRG
ncbi:NLR family CARD domain-containing protein 3-like [Ptychodera flava]|uniref:NLR family CARD domain-containing protein 3-like n=1 Tax=Ptychodera flava TaxID=63121 RepID=UPI00396A9257